MRWFGLLVMVWLVAGCAGGGPGSQSSMEKTKTQGRLTDGIGASSGPQFYREGDPTSRHESYLRQGL